MPIKIVKSMARMLTEGAYNGFLLHLTRFSPQTQLVYLRVIKRFSHLAPKYIHQITPEHIEQFILKAPSASTGNLWLSAIRSWFNWLEITHDVRNIGKKVERLSALPPKQRIPSYEEYLQVISCTDGYMRDCIAFLANTGLRATAFLSLTPENIKDKFIMTASKGNKQYYPIPMNRTVKEILKRNPHLNFIKSRNRVWLWRLCSNAAKLSNIPHFSPHSLRHFFATELHNNHVPIETISKLLDHSNTLVTEKVYIHWKQDELLGTTDVLDDNH